MEVNRRDFLKVLGIGGATAMTSCSSQPPEKLIPYLIPVETLIPGRAAWYASVCRECPAGCGVLVKTMEGRALKVEGNPDHPVNRGRLCARGQAALQGLYNPDRIRQPLLRDGSNRFQATTWSDAEAWLLGRLAEIRRQGKGPAVAWITPHLTGTLDELIDRWLASFGSKRRLRYEPFAPEAINEANRLTFGLEAIPSYEMESSKLIIAFGADFLETWLSPVAYARQFAAMRAEREGHMGRFIFVGPRLSLTGANADQWVPIAPGTEGTMALGMVRTILAKGLSRDVPSSDIARLKHIVEPYSPHAVSQATGVEPEHVERLAHAFGQADPGLALVGGAATGGPNATATAVAVNLLNYVAGNIGRTVRFGPLSSLSRVSRYRDVLAFARQMERGQVSALFFTEVNPAFSFPKAVGFDRAMGAVPLVVACSTVLDETNQHAHVILPTHTPLESWGDYEPAEGVHGLIQPAMEPVYQTKSLGDLLLWLARGLGGPEAPGLNAASFHDLLRNRWKEIHRRIGSARDFETFWEQALQRGGEFTTAQVRTVRLRPDALSQPLRDLQLQPGKREDGLVLVAYPSLAHFDGRGANRPWLQELPDPLAQLTWDNWLEVHPDDANGLGISEGDLLTVTSPYGEIELPAHLYAGLWRRVVAVQIGQGHTTYGRYAADVGANVYALLPADPEPRSGGLRWLSDRVNLRRTGKRHLLASVSGSDRQYDRGIAQAIALDQLLQGEHRPRYAAGHPPGTGHVIRQIYAPHEHPHHRWGMAIDLNACIGCSACVVACYAENNLPVVGKQQVARGREMSWIRIERYVEGQPGHPDTRFVPMLCQHCDNAPCEPVCPVYATIHNAEGLNVQVYNRCVGTRYCSNNCPYKVRRFNWFTYQWPEPLHMQLNPDVTVREKGVMEKCTFCLQRITQGKARARDEGRRLRDGDIIPACAQTCPTRAIVFGDLKDPDSEVSRVSKSPRAYRIFDHLNTQPAITYLKKIQHAEEEA